METLKFYSPPEAELLHFATLENLCYDESKERSADDISDGFGGIELPDDNWGQGSGDGGVELPDDNFG